MSASPWHEAFTQEDPLVFVQDTYPPCVYMNSTSHLVCQLIHQVKKVCGAKIEKVTSQLNNHFGELVATYTFDAGPNACIFLTEKVLIVILVFIYIFKDRS